MTLLNLFDGVKKYIKKYDSSRHYILGVQFVTRRQTIQCPCEMEAERVNKSEDENEDEDEGGFSHHQLGNPLTVTQYDEAHSTPPSFSVQLKYISIDRIRPLLQIVPNSGYHSCFD